jgi:hypothetical protein
MGTQLAGALSDPDVEIVGPLLGEILICELRGGEGSLGTSRKTLAQWVVGFVRMIANINLGFRV